MKKSRLVYIILIALLLLGVQSSGYYTRNLKVDDIFLTTVAQSIKDLETKRENNESHTYDDYLSMRRVLNDGEMGENSNAEMDIGFAVQGMSKFLYEYYYALSKNMTDEANTNMNKYNQALMKAEDLLRKYREENDTVESLWSERIFH